MFIVGAFTEIRGQEVRDDRFLMQGAWQLIAGEKSGKAFPEAGAKGVQIVFNNSQMTAKNSRNVFTFPFRLVPDTQPCGIDLVMNESLGKGIYRESSVILAHGIIQFLSESNALK